MSLTIEVIIDESVLEGLDVNKMLFVMGELILNKIKEYVRQMELVDTGAYLQGWFASVSNNKIIIENTQSYAGYLEYGTYQYHDMFDEETFPNPVEPKKKDMITKADRESYPKGMQPFAPVRRVLYDDLIMTDIVQKAVEVVI
jgi:hypothetical protein